MFTEQIISGNIVVIDSATNLMWAKEYVTDKTWKAAVDYCENLVYAGYDDWRLPTAEELLDLIDYTRYKPASNFPGMPSERFWSFSVYVDDSDYAWSVNFGDGSLGSPNKARTYYARCVRG